MTHRSSGHNNNERLEYLGDALLGFIIAEAVYNRFSQASEGDLTRLRATLVKRETLAKLGRQIELGKYLKLGSGELKSGGWQRDSILANTLESIIGAIYLDSNIDICRECVIQLYEPLLADISPDTLDKDPKTRLQEYLQAHKQPLPKYKVIAEEGEVHARNFTVECQVNGLKNAIVAQGRSKRRAEQSAAQKALEMLQS